MEKAKNELWKSRP